ncbi:phage portal protein [Bradyrhizobium cenepequi]
MQAQTKPRYRIGSDGSNARMVDVPAGRSVSAGYMRTDNHQPFFFSWNPVLRDQKWDVRSAYVQAAARTIDMLHNSGWIAGAVEKAISSMIGTGLRLAAKPSVELFKTKGAADEWARNVEARFETVANNPCEVDAAGVQNLGQLTKSGLHSYFSHGEILALIPRIDNPYARTRAKLKVLPAHKLVQDSNGVEMFQGVKMTGWGFPLAYKISLRAFESMDAEYDTIVPARDAIGRQQVLHAFDGIAGQVRGITPLASALKVVKQFDNLADNTLQAALIQAIFAATIQSQAPTADILQALQDDQEQGVGGDMGGYLASKGTWYENTKIDLGRGGKIAHLFPGEELKFNAATTPHDNYEAFARMLLREIAAGLGMTYEGVTGDYTGATYSSVRMSISENWPIIQYRRKNVASHIPQAFYNAWLDEEIESGNIQFPGGIDGFRENHAAATKADWRGPPKPQADDLKTQAAYEGYARMGVMSMEQICAELGTDWEDVLEARQREMEKRKQLGLPEGDTYASAEADKAKEIALLGDKKEAGNGG